MSAFYISAVSSGDGRQLGELAHDILIAAAAMGQHTGGTVLDPVLQPMAVAAALAAQRIQRTVAEQAVEILRMCRLVAGEEFTGRVLHKGVTAFAGLFIKHIVTHHASPFPFPPVILRR